MLEQILTWEREAFLWLHGGHTPFWDMFIWLYSGKFAWIPAAMVILFTLIRKKRWSEWLILLIFIALVILLCDRFTSGFCKPFFARLRPTHHPDFAEQIQTVFGYRGGRYGFISGHAANAFGFAVFTLMLFRNRCYTIVILLWSLCMIYTRIYLGVHFISDVVPGAVVGALFGFACYKLYVPTRRAIVGRRYPPVYTRAQIRIIICAIALTLVGMLAYTGIMQIAT